MSKQDQEYRGFEQGPIRPPSEAHSLLIRVTRNCPYNRCSFCPVYKEARYSTRPVEHVIRDIDGVHSHIEAIRQLADGNGNVSRTDISELSRQVPHAESDAFNAAVSWYFGGAMKSVFLQDANSLIIKADELVEILNHLRERFPSAERITSYSRAHTITRKTDEELLAIRKAGLNRVHIGMESGSDEVLKAVKKGATKELHIEAGLKVKKAGIELSEYIMPGLGGKVLSEIHAIESADAVNRIDPDFVRLRTLAIPETIPLYEDYRDGRFQKCTDVETARETLTFLEQLNGFTGTIRSDHILNLFEDLEGKWPEEGDRMIGILKDFLAMEAEDQRLYQVGRRIGVFRSLDHMQNPTRLAHAKRACKEFGVTEDNVDEITDHLMMRFI